MKAGQGDDRENRLDLYEQINRVSAFALLNLLWVILSIPLITMPAVTVGLFAVITRWVRGKHPELFVVFLSAIRQFWRKATLAGLLDAAIIGLLVFNVSVFPMMDMSNPLVFVSRSVTLGVGLVALLVNLYLWPLMAMWDVPLRDLLKASFRLAMAFPLRSIGLLILSLIPIIASLFLPAIVLLFGAVSAFAWIASWGTWRIVRQHAKPEELAAFEN